MGGGGVSSAWEAQRARSCQAGPALTRASMYSILRSRAVSFSFSVASLERQDISGKRMWFKDKVSSNKDMGHATPKSSPPPKIKQKEGKSTRVCMGQMG